jgi:hypothetical protein
MSFSGDLEYLSIVDVIQLLHSTRKTGTLKIVGRKGEISLVFNDGYINGASHYDTGTRTGTILVEAGVISQEDLDRALAIQSQAGADRRPLIATLLENNLVAKDDAYRGLETLIELSIVEILTWKKGTFALEPDTLQICDEFRYFPEKLQEELNLPTEHVLMDALRIYDEKKRDGLIVDEELHDEELPSAPAATAEGDLTISADDLGLGDLDAIQRKRPTFHEALRDEPVGLAAGLAPAAVLKEAMGQLKKVATLPETALILLKTVGAIFPRALTLVAWEKDLVAERGIGINTEPATGPGPVLGFKLPLAPGSLLSFVLDKGHLFFGKSQDQVLRDHLYGVITPPLEPTVLILPLKLGKRVVSVTYADFGTQSATAVPIDLLASCAEYAGLAIESALSHAQQSANKA